MSRLEKFLRCFILEEAPKGFCWARKSPRLWGGATERLHKRLGVIFMYSLTQQILIELALCDILVGTLR